LRPRTAKSNGVLRDRQRNARVEFARFFIARHHTACIAAERDLLSKSGGEFIDTRGAEQVFGLILDGEELVSGYYLNCVPWFIGIGTNVV
jgi:hypothetical protein